MPPWKFPGSSFPVGPRERELFQRSWETATLDFPSSPWRRSHAKNISFPLFHFPNLPRPQETCGKACNFQRHGGRGSLFSFFHAKAIGPLSVDPTGYEICSIETNSFPLRGIASKYRIGIRISHYGGRESAVATEPIERCETGRNTGINKCPASIAILSTATFPQLGSSNESRETIPPEFLSFLVIHTRLRRGARNTLPSSLRSADLLLISIPTAWKLNIRGLHKRDVYNEDELPFCVLYGNMHTMCII